MVALNCFKKCLQEQSARVFNVGEEAATDKDGAVAAAFYMLKTVSVAIKSNGN